MAKTPDAGRFTPKKDPKAAGPKVGGSGAHSVTKQPAYKSSGRYTPPIPAEMKPK